MSFKVKVTLIGFLGNTERYPCHFNHKVGDEVIFDGEKYIAKRKKRLLKSTVQFIKTILFVTIMIFTFLIVNSLTIAKFKINF